MSGRGKKRHRWTGDHWGEFRNSFSIRSSKTISPSFPDDPIGYVFMVGNRFLGIPSHLSLRHPCCVISGEGNIVSVSKGTDLRNVLPHMRDLYVVVYPDGTNGLIKPTAFETLVRQVPLKALFSEDCLGCLSPEDLKRIQEAVFRNGW